MITNQQQLHALWALDGIQEIVEAEMLIQGAYIGNDIEAPERIRNICGGRKACAVGSLYVGYGIKPHLKDEYWELEGVNAYERDDYMESRPSLRLAYDSLNEAASMYIEAHGDGLKRKSYAVQDIAGSLEILFEAYKVIGSREFMDEKNVSKEELLPVIKVARELIITNGGNYIDKG